MDQISEVVLVYLFRIKLINYPFWQFSKIVFLVVFVDGIFHYIAKKLVLDVSLQPLKLYQVHCLNVSYSTTIPM